MTIYFQSIALLVGSNISRIPEEACSIVLRTFVMLCHEKITYLVFFPSFVQEIIAKIFYSVDLSRPLKTPEHAL